MRTTAIAAAATVIAALAGCASTGASGSGKQTGTVEYVVTGSPADVTYGPAGSDHAGSVPMDKTAPLGNPQYYSISAQLKGHGSVTCKIKVNGKTISRATADGAYNIAMCEISPNVFSGKWQDTNAS